MTGFLPSRGTALVLLVPVGLALLFMSRFGGTFESALYLGYGLLMPFVFLAMILGAIYFGAKHLLTR